MDIDWLNSMYRQLVKEAEGNHIELERRLEIRKELSMIRRIKRKAKEEISLLSLNLVKK
jgi:hypothetical protein